MAGAVDDAGDSETAADQGYVALAPSRWERRQCAMAAPTHSAERTDRAGLGPGPGFAVAAAPTLARFRRNG